MDDGLWWAIVVLVGAMVMSICIGHCKYEACLEAGFTEKQCRFEALWNH